MKRLLVGLALLCGASVGQAQIATEFINFATYTGANQSGFTATLLIRNTNAYSDPFVTYTESTFLVGLSERVRTACLTTAVSCDFRPVGLSYGFGAVQTGNAVVNGTLLLGGGAYGDFGCAGMFCLSAFVERSAGSIFGCNVPSGSMIVYIGRTCAADGFTGAVALDLRFSFSPATPGASVAVSVDDIIPPTIGVRNVAIVTPEPATWALMLVGLGGLAVSATRRRLS